MYNNYYAFGPHMVKEKILCLSFTIYPKYQPLEYCEDHSSRSKNPLTQLLDIQEFTCNIFHPLRARASSDS